MSVVVQLLQGAAAIGALVFGYVKLSAAERISAHSLIKRIAVLALMLLVVATSIWHVTEFMLGDGPPSRREILWLLVNLWNMTIYAILFIGLLAYLIKQPLHRQDDRADEALLESNGS